MTDRRRSICSRDPERGRGSCWFWWELCPAKIGDCFQRHMRAWAAEHGITEEREKAMSEEELALELGKAVAAWPSKRLAERTLFDRAKS